MTSIPPIQLELGQVIRLRKPHPCGGYEWRVTRLGADIGLSCLICGRQVMLPRSEIERRIVICGASGAPQAKS